MPGYRDEYSDFQRNAYWTLPKICGLVVVFGLLATGAAWVLGMFGETATVVHDQFGPQALLVKYEWFKDASAQLDKKMADIAVYQNRFESLQATYAGIPRTQWARDDREQLSIWQSEVSGIKASYNSLAAEYNAQMSKFNYRFTNVGDLPAGATVPLPREYRPYLEQ